MQSILLGLGAFLCFAALALFIAAAVVWSTYANTLTLVYVGIACLGLGIIAGVAGLLIPSKSTAPATTAPVVVTAPTPAVPAVVEPAPAVVSAAPPATISIPAVPISA